MDRGEVARELREMSQYYEADAETFDAAIALIEPQPVTEAGLREAGFRCVGHETLALDLGEHVFPWIEYQSGRFRLHSGGHHHKLRIADMQTLHAVIAALRGQA